MSCATSSTKTPTSQDDAVSNSFDPVLVLCRMVEAWHTRGGNTLAQSHALFNAVQRVLERPDATAVNDIDLMVEAIARYQSIGALQLKEAHESYVVIAQVHAALSAQEAAAAAAVAPCGDEGTQPASFDDCCARDPNP